MDTKTWKHFIQVRFSLYWSTWWKTTKRIHKKSLSSNQICTNLNCTGLLQLWLILLWRVVCVCLCVCVCARVRQSSSPSFIRKNLHLAGRGVTNVRTHKHAHVSVFEILQYRGQENDIPPPSQVHLQKWGFAAQLESANSHQLPQIFVVFFCFFVFSSVKIPVQTGAALWTCPSGQREGRSINL